MTTLTSLTEAGPFQQPEPVDRVGSNAIVPEWIVCHATARSVADGIVVCPDRLLSTWSECLGCRFLEAADGDRDPERSCSV